MTPEQRKRVEFLADPRWFLEEAALAPRVCLEERDAFEVIARRVHEECGPTYMDWSDSSDDLNWRCKACECAGITRDDIAHPPSCLWLAVDAMKKTGQL